MRNAQHNRESSLELLLQDPGSVAVKRVIKTLSTILGKRGSSVASTSLLCMCSRLEHMVVTLERQCLAAIGPVPACCLQTASDDPGKCRNKAESLSLPVKESPAG